MEKDEIEKEENALCWIKKNSHTVIEKFANSAEFVSEAHPTTLFMAGSPGAGKTEFSKRFIERFSQKPIRIDADEIRSVCPGYSGENAYIYQKAANKGVNILYDYALKNNVSVILDGTFAYGGAFENIERSLAHSRKVQIFFVYQEPLQAWDFTKKREATECRNVPKDVFIDSFFKSRENVNGAKEKFGQKIELNLVIKDFEKDLEKLELNIDSVDHYIGKDYNREDLNSLLK